jgi:glycosyltransferase involved in cell wall biosynthesis
MTPYAVLLTDQCLVPPWGGNRVRIWGIIRALRDLGWRVALVTVRSNPVDFLLELVDRVFYVPVAAYPGGDLRAYNVEPYQRVLAEVARTVRPALAIAEYAWLAPALRWLPRSVLRCVDCHDILSERTARFRAAGLDPWIVCSPELERELLDQADVLIAIQPVDAAWLGTQLPGKTIACLPPYIDLPEGFRRVAPKALEVLFVGTVHAGNYGIRTFVRDHWAEVTERIPGACLRIVGSVGDDLDTTPGVEAVGRVRHLAEHYASAAVVICPIEVGTGIKIKVVEALRYGKAVVASEVAVEGLPTPPEPAWIAHVTLAECADSVVTLLSDPERRSRMERAAFAFGEREFSRDIFLSRLVSILPGRARQIVASLGI